MGKAKNLVMNEMKELFLGSVTQRLMKQMVAEHDKILEASLRIYAEPPIKGEITKGKIRWRGIRLIRQQVGLDSYSWLEQRGKQISPKFHIEANLPKLNVG
ncbi:MAG: hypothetical protein KAJ19_25625 [Gammaproteobacteria bacterium]|nr:hypothetical protein [Gammaproteobacteria bacterium]